MRQTIRGRQKECPAGWWWQRRTLRRDAEVQAPAVFRLSAASLGIGRGFIAPAAGSCTSSTMLFGSAPFGKAAGFAHARQNHAQTQVVIVPAGPASRHERPRVLLTGGAMEASVCWISRVNMVSNIPFTSP